MTTVEYAAPGSRPLTTSRAVQTTTDRAFVGVVLLALLVSQVTAIALGLWHPDNNFVPYIEAHRDSWWLWHTISGLVFVVTAGAYAAVMWWLVPGRGRVLAVTGGFLMAAGVAAFGAGLTAEAAADWYSSSTGALTPEQSHALLVYVNDHGSHFDGAITAGLILTIAGPIVSTAGLVMSRRFPWWLIALFVVGAVAGTIFGPLEALSLVAYGLLSWRLLQAG